MDVGVNQQCLLCPSLRLSSNYKLCFLCCNGISHAGEGRLFLLPVVMCSINPPDTLILLQFGSGSKHLSQALPDQFNQSSFQPDVNYLMNSIWMCGCACIRVVMGTEGT